MDSQPFMPLFISAHANWRCPRNGIHDFKLYGSDADVYRTKCRYCSAEGHSIKREDFAEAMRYRGGRVSHPADIGKRPGFERIPTPDPTRRDCGKALPHVYRIDHLGDEQVGTRCIHCLSEGPSLDRKGYTQVLQRQGIEAPRVGDIFKPRGDVQGAARLGDVKGAGLAVFGCRGGVPHEFKIYARVDGWDVTRCLHCSVEGRTLIAKPFTLLFRQLSRA